MRSTAPYRLLIVSGNRSVTDRFVRLLQVFDSIELISSVTTAQDGVMTAREARQDVLLVDVSLPDMDGIQLTELIRRDNPEIQVIILAKEKLGEVVLNAMRSGASDFLTYEVPLEELRLSVHRAGELAVAEKKKRGSYEQGRGFEEEEEKVEKKGKVITVYSPKGGTGVTTLAVNLAVALQGADTTVALIDVDLQYGDVGLLLNEVPSLSILDLVSRIYELDTAMVEDVMVLHKSSGVHILTAPPRPEFAEKVSEAHFTTILDHLRQIFDYIVINTSVFITESCLAALEAADLVVLIASQEIANVRNIHSFLVIWENLGKSKDRLVLVINRYVAKRNINPEKIGERLTLQVASVIPEDELVFRSLNLGIPFMVNEKGSQPAQLVNDLAKHIRGDLE